jgi:hypothetical protein
VALIEMLREHPRRKLCVSPGKSRLTPAQLRTFGDSDQIHGDESDKPTAHARFGVRVSDG